MSRGFELSVRPSKIVSRRADILVDFSSYIFTKFSKLCGLAKEMSLAHFFIAGCGRNVLCASALANSNDRIIASNACTSKMNGSVHEVLDTLILA